MANYNYPGYNGNNAPEYNVNGDAANGRQGSYSQGAIANRLQERKDRSGASNPYAELLDHIRAARQPQQVPPVATNLPQPDRFQYSTNLPQRDVMRTPTNLPQQGNDPYRTATNLPQPDMFQFSSNQTGTGAATNPQQPDRFQALPAQWPPSNPQQPDRFQASTNLPQRDGMQTSTNLPQPDMFRYASNQNLGADDPGYVPTPSNPPQAPPDTDTGGRVPFGANKPQINPGTGKPYGAPIPAGVDPALWNDVDRYVQTAGAQGYDYSFLYQHPEWVTEFRNWAIKNNAPQVDIVDWLAYEHPELPPLMQGRSGSDTMYDYMHRPLPPGTIINVPTPGNPPQSPDPTKPPTTDPNLQGPQAPPPPQTIPPPNFTQPPQRPDTTQFSPQSDQALEGILHKYLDPTYRQGQTDLANQMNSQAALTGDTNAGGYQEVFGRDMGRLVGQQNADFAGKLGDARNLEQQLATQRYGIDKDKFLGQLDDDTKRLGIQTNAQLQMYMDQSDNALKKYGIDSDRLMQQYIEELRLKGVQYSADKAFDAEAMRNATQKLLGDQNYNLGLADLGYKQYEHDNPGLLDILKLYMGMSPEQLALAGMSGINFPNWVYQQPTGGK